VEARLLLPPGIEPHNFEPRPEDVIQLNKADIFIYTNSYMEPWADGLLKGIPNKGLEVVDASAGVTFIRVAGPDEHAEHGTGGHDHHGEGMDPHVWLSIPNAEKMVDNITAALAKKDPAGSASYRRNAEAYRARLAGLDGRFKEGLAGCRHRLFLHGGHYAFGYLAHQYGLTYVSAYAVSADAEPTPKKLIELVNLMKQNSLTAIFYEELLSPRVAETIARETGATLLKLHGIHNVSREDLAGGATYISLMEQNLKNLRTGLQCR
ncbi:MAG TPA: zinc ABC transporter substrate-binding protein, partial [Geobacteraceae bacterium]|nr:zinc ABC transporter substrate-binding protein [Geobacteraceae bacterium]